jgi:hypothetical protein
MKKVYQTKFGNKSGNCFPACVASILEIPLESIPNVCVLGEDWFDAFLFWCATMGFSYVELREEYRKMTDGQLCIVVGKSPRKDIRHHCVVGRFENEEIEIVHDPHPDETGIDSIEQYGVFIPVNPRKRT